MPRGTWVSLGIHAGGDPGGFGELRYAVPLPSAALLRRWILRVAWSAAVVFVTIVIGGALDARRRLPDLQPWHRIIPRDLRAGDLKASSTLADYLAIEDAAFRTVRERIEDRLDPALKVPANRYNPEGLSHPSRLGDGMGTARRSSLRRARRLAAHCSCTVSPTAPYSMPGIGEDLRGLGYHVVALRVPGHGTVPAGLTDVTWEDWLAAVRIAARDLRSRIGADKPLVLVGLFERRRAGAEVCARCDRRVGDPQAARIVLLSPMIGVSKFAWLARVISMLGPLPAFEKARWLDVYPEYNPNKDNSFPAQTSGLQTWRLTTTMQAQIARIAESGRSRELPPLLTFHSLVDATVSTPAVVHRALRRGCGRTFGTGDFRHQSIVRTRPVHPAGGRSAHLAPDRRVGASVSAHARHERQSIVARRRRAHRGAGRDDCGRASAGAGLATRRLLPVARRDSVPSLDPVYGREETGAVPATIRLGVLSPRGERAVLSVPSDTLMRLTCNPFFSYLSSRISPGSRRPLKFRSSRPDNRGIRCISFGGRQPPYQGVES